MQCLLNNKRNRKWQHGYLEFMKQWLSSNRHLTIAKHFFPRYWSLEQLLLHHRLRDFLRRLFSAGHTLNERLQRKIERQHFKNDDEEVYLDKAGLHKHIYIYIIIYICILIYLSIYIYIYIYTHTNAHTYIHPDSHTHIYIYAQRDKCTNIPA